jgi:hypothetical protein
MYATVALMPLRVNLQPFLRMKDKFYFSPLDLLLPVLALLMLRDLFRRSAWARFRVPPLAGVAWVLLALASCLWITRFPAGGTLASWLKAALDPLLCAVVGVWVFQNFSSRLSDYRRLALVLGGSFSVCLLLALRQYAGPTGLPYNPQQPGLDLGGVSNIRLGGWYDFRGVLGAQTALIAPAAAAFALLDKDMAVRVAAGAVTLVSLSVTLAASGFLAAAAGLIALAGAVHACRCKRAGLTLLMLLLGFLFIILPRLPRNNPAVLQRGIALFADDGGVKKPTARLRRYQAELDLLGAPCNPHDPDSAPFWVKGVGAGQYQEHVNEFYHSAYPRPAGRTDAESLFDMESPEPYTFGLLETVSVELGVPGLLLLLFLFATWLWSAGAALAKIPNVSDDPQRTMLALAALGAGSGALVLSLLNNPAIRSVGGTFAFFFALALVVCHTRTEEKGS